MGGVNQLDKYGRSVSTQDPSMLAHPPCSKIVITPDSEKHGVITPDFTTPVKGLK